MRKDNLHTSKDARTLLMSGISKVANAVGATMGTSGSNAVIECIENPGHITTNDGYSIANSIVLSDPIEEMGRKILVESINRANKASGDGSSTTCVLTASIIEAGMKHTEASPMDIKRSLEACLPLIEESINAQKRELFKDGVLDSKLLEQVATVSAEDEEIGKRIAEIYQEIGKDGIIHWDISKTIKDEYTIGQGITIEGAGWYSPYMCDATESGQSTNQIRIKNPHILITKQKISTVKDFEVLAATLDSKQIKDLVVFCDDIEPLVVPDIVKTRMMRGFRIVIVKMPVIFKDHWFSDLSLATKATVIDPTVGMSLKDARTEHLGRCGNIVVTKDETYLDGIEDLSFHIALLKAENTDESVLRASRLNTKTARYFVGAQSDSALSYRRLKVEDAISAAWQALQGGVVAGGGSALVTATNALNGFDGVGHQILQSALLAPAQRIAQNSGHWEIVVGDFIEGHGFDTKSGQFVNMFDAGIIDPANVVLNAVKNAISVAATVLTASTVVTLPREDAPLMMMPPVSR